MNPRATARRAAAAGRVSVRLPPALGEFVGHRVIVEKYAVERRDSQVSAGLRFGYASNEVGFGRANAAFTELCAHPGRQPARAGARRRQRELIVTGRQLSVASS